VSHEELRVSHEELHVSHNYDVKKLDEQLQEMKLKQRKQEILLSLHDLGVVFRFYFITPNIKITKYSTWGKFVDEFWSINEMVDNGIVDISLLNNFKDSLNSKLPQY
jgi:hypothetical protein